MTRADAIRDSPAGAFVRWMAPGSLPHQEELPSFEFDRPDLCEKTVSNEDLKAPITCGWYSDTDPDNPHNWSRLKKLWISANVLACAFVVYMSAPIWTPSTNMFAEEFGTGHEYTSLGLALFVLGYGIGPLLFSPLSEIPSIGRSCPYIVTFILFMIVTIPTALVRNAPAFMFFRFWQGFFGSPILATGGASIADVYDAAWTSIALSAWGAACFAAPVVGQIIASAAIAHLGWRFSIWEILIAGAPVLLMMLFMPETSSPTILYYRAQRLRKAVGDDRIRSDSEITQHHLDFRTIVVESLLVPAKITILDPAVLFITIYLCIIYGIYYSFFEAFPLVYADMYQFSLLRQGLAFLPIAIGTVFSVCGYAGYLYYYRKPKVQAGIDVPPEQILIPALYASFLPPIGLFLFGWLSRPDVHWIASMVGIALYPAGVFTIFQSLLAYLAEYKPRFTASLFAASDFTRSSFAFAAILFSRPMFLTLGIGGGNSLLAGLMICCIFGLFAIHHYGPKLRARSRFEAKW